MNVSPTPETGDDPDGELQGPSYAYKPNLIGTPWEFTLKADGLAWQLGRRSGFIRYDRVRRVRMSYRPATLQSHRFLTEIWAPDSPKIQICSTSFRSLMELARQDAAYTGFVTEFHRRVAASRTAAQFSSGMNPIIYWMGASIFVVVGLSLVALVIRALALGDVAAAAVVVGILLLFLWQVGSIFYRNRPQTYRPETPPAIILPRR